MEEPVTFALNAHSWLSGRINEGMTPKQCHTTHCDSQQVEENTGWNRHSSGDLHNRQIDSQDEGSRKIYIIREISRRGRQFGRRQEVLLVEYQKRKKRIHSRTRPKDGP